MAAHKPHIFFVPGGWEPPSVFDGVRSILHEQGYSTTVAPIESTGKTNPQNGSDAAKYTGHTDAIAIRALLEPLVVEQGLQVIAVQHSAGGILGSWAMEGLTEKARKDKGLPGGVIKIVFITAGIVPVGSPFGEYPFFTYEGDRMICGDPRGLLFNDWTDEAEIERHVQQLSHQPAFGWWDAVVTFAGWQEVPSVYLLCDQDKLLPPEVQKMLAELAESEVVTCEAGHMVMLSQPQTVANVVIAATA